MFTWELKKILIKNKGIIIGFVLMLLTIVLSFSYQLEISELGSDTEKYLTIIEEYKGQITDENVQKIEQEYQEYINSSKYLSELQEQYGNDEISEEEYFSKSEYYIEKKNNLKSFRYFYQQYLEVSNKSNTAYLMDTRGWNVVFQDEIYSMILILTIISIAVPCFMKENECEMDQIIKTCRHGRKKFFALKIGALLLVVFALTLCSQLLRFIIIYERFDLSGFLYPMQSISMFKGSYFNIPIVYAYIVCVGLQVVGALALCAFCVFIGYVIKKQIPTLIFATLLNILSFIIFQSKTIFTYFPMPGNYFFSSIYLKGPQYTEILEDSKFVSKEVFAGLTPMSLIIVIIYTVICSYIFIYISRCAYLSKRPKLGKLKSIGCVFVGLLLCGCQSNVVRDTSFVYDNMNGMNSYVTLNNASIYISEEGDKIIYETVNETTNLIKDPLFNETIDSIFVNNGYCYYAYFKDNMLYISRICLDNYESEIVFKEKEVNTNDFFGLVKKSEVSVEDYIIGFYVDGRYIYYFTISGFYQINLLNQTTTSITDNYWSVGSYYYYGKIFYI